MATKFEYGLGAAFAIAASYMMMKKADQEITAFFAQPSYAEVNQTVRSMADDALSDNTFSLGEKFISCMPNNDICATGIVTRMPDIKQPPLIAIVEESVPNQAKVDFRGAIYYSPK